MSERRLFSANELLREVVVIDDQGEKRLYLLKCSRRRLGELLTAALQKRNSAVT